MLQQIFYEPIKYECLLQHRLMRRLEFVIVLCYDANWLYNEPITEFANLGSDFLLLGIT